MSARASVVQYLGNTRADGQSSRAILGKIRRRLILLAEDRRREDVAALLNHSASERFERCDAVRDAIELLRTLPPPAPLLTDEVRVWLLPRIARALHEHGLRTLAELTVRVPRRRRWWTAVPGLGAAGARQVEAFFAAHPDLTQRAHALVLTEGPQDVVPWERLRVPGDVDGSRGTFRAPAATCVLSAMNDHEAVQTWLALPESPATQRAYRKEAERLILWSILERGRALTSLTTEDAIAYRTFLRRPSPRRRWVGPPRPRGASDWKPFAGDLSARSASYALSVVGAMFRWLLQQRYTLANPFAGVKVRGGAPVQPLAAARFFSEGEWALIRAIADGLEWGRGWSLAAAQRLRFVLDFAYATGLRVSELVGAGLGQIEVDALDDHWLHLVGKGGRSSKVALPSLARVALDRYLLQRGVPSSRTRWNPNMLLVGEVDLESNKGITSTRLWSILRRFFLQAAEAVADDRPALAEKLRLASPHWMRHTHATHALARGVELTTVRDNLRHASIQTTSTYLHADEVLRSRQINEAFPARDH
jgi:site-specific recombinase XerD